MKETNKTELFETMPVPKAITKMAVPTVMAMLVTVLYNLADTYFVGMLNDPLETAAVTLAAPVLLAFNAVNNLFGVGSSSMMSRALGLKDYDTVRRSSAFGLYCAFFSAVLFSAFATIFRLPLLHLLGAGAENMAPTSAYMLYTVSLGAAPAILNVVMSYLFRSEGASLHAGIGTMSGCVLNIILDPFFILPQFLNMGAAGAGFATFISNCVALIYFLVLMFVRRGKSFISIHPRDFRPSRRIVREVFGVGIPACIQNLLNVVGMTILNNFCAAFGSEAVSAMGISHKITMIPMYVALGISQGAMPLVGYNFASGNHKRMKQAVLFSIKVGVTVALAGAALYWIFAGPIIRAFMENELVVEYGSAFIRGFCIAQPFLAMDFIAVGVFQACGMGGRSLVFAILRKIVLEIPAIIILNKIWPMYGLSYSQFAAELILAIAAVIFLIRIFRNLEKKTALK